jgi:hypothetical protein
LGLRSLPYFAELLPYALAQTSQPNQRIEVVKTYVGTRKDIEAWLEVIHELSMGESTMLPSLIAETFHAMIERFRSDRIALARAIVRMTPFDVAFALFRNLAHAYQRAALTDAAEPTPEDERAQFVLAMVFGDNKPRKSPGKGRAKRKKKDTRKPDLQNGTSQLELPLDGSEP